jgi:membrane protein
MTSATWHHRGREADSPKEVPPSGWKDTLIRVKEGIKEDKVTLLSAAMAYYALFALVPSLSALVLTYAWISDPAQISQHISQASQFIPEELQRILNSQLTTLSSKASGQLGLSAIFSVLLALWGASRGSKSVIESLNVIYNENDNRGFIKQNALALGLTLLGLVLAIIALGVIVVIPNITNILKLGPNVSLVMTAVSWVILLGLFSFFLSIIYRFGPDRKVAKWRWVSWGAVIASVLWVIASGLFSWYAKEFGNFNKTYGSLSVMIVLMTWFYLSSLVILLGGEINAELEHQTKKDSTKGREKPIGSRGAQMADTVGKSSWKH